MDSYGRAIVLEPSADGGTVVVRLGEVAELPDDFTAIVGDFFHNVRAALDHIAWQLVLLDGGVPTRATAFPVRLRRPAGGVDIPPGVNATTLAALEKVQPYNWGDDPANFHLAPLAVLSHLNNVDKHRVPLIGVTVLAGGSWSSSPEQEVTFHRSAERRDLRSGDVVGHFTVRPAGTPVHDAKLDFKLRLVDDSEAREYARFDFVDWAMGAALRYVEFGVLRHVVPLFEAGVAE